MFDEDGNYIDPVIASAKDALLLTLQYHNQFSGLPLHEFVDVLAIFMLQQTQTFDKRGNKAKVLDEATTYLEECCYSAWEVSEMLEDPEMPIAPAIASAKDALLLSIHHHSQFSVLPLYEVIDVLATFVFQQSQKFDKRGNLNLARRLDEATGGLEESYYAILEVPA